MTISLSYKRVTWLGPSKTSNPLSDKFVKLGVNPSVAEDVSDSLVLATARGIRSHGIKCDLGLVVFKYNIFKEADILMKGNNIKVYNLTDWEDVYNQMRFMNKFDSSILLEIRKFLDDPVAWSNYKDQTTKL